MNLLGQGVPQNIELALAYFEMPVMEKDSRALNAAGYIYFYAPDALDKDQAMLNLFGSIRRDKKKAYKNFRASSKYGSINAKYNLGALYLAGEKINEGARDEDDRVSLSFSKAYEWFR